MKWAKIVISSRFYISFGISIRAENQGIAKVKLLKMKLLNSTST